MMGYGYGYGNYDYPEDRETGSPGEGWEHCTNSEKSAEDVLSWAQHGWGDEFEYKVVEQAYASNGEILPDHVAVWRKPKNGDEVPE